MFHKLRIKFIVIASIAVTIILTSFVGVINSVRQFQYNNEINTILEVLLSENENVTNLTLEERLIKNNVPPSRAAEIAYFGYVFNENGIISSSIYNLKNFHNEDLLEFAKNVDYTKASGLVSLGRNYYTYVLTEKENAKELVAIDVTPYIQHKSDLMSTSIQMYVYSMVFFIVVVSILSGWAIKPYVINAENQKKFITNAGHELKTPLAIIAANTEMQEMLTGETEWSKSTNEQIQRMSELINNLVTLAKLEEQQDIKLSDVNFSNITTKAAEDIKTLIIKNNKEFIVDITPDIIVKAEEKSLFELVMILLDNANKYCDENGKVNIKLSYNSLKKAKLEVSNTYAEGKNIDLKKFFERFYRGDESHNSKISGYGIGLSMAQSLTKKFRGKLTINYEIDTITFTVVF